MALDEQISFCEEKSKNIKLKAEPQTFVDIKNSLEKLKSPWIPVSERLPECCGYPVLLTVENKFNQRFVCKAFTNYMEEGNPLFYKKSARKPMVFRPWDEWRHELSIYILLKTLHFSKIYAMICIQENPFPSP